MYINFYLIFFIFVVFDYQQVSTRGGRGGGSRSGSSRSGSRGGSRSGTSGKIGVSSRYSMWSGRHGFSSSFRYRTSSYYTKRNGFTAGLIIMSPHYRSTFVIHNDKQYDDISICYNELPLYGRNISASPWFVCPWDNPRSSYCCGDELEERCCNFFERSGRFTLIIIGCIIFPASAIIYYFYKRSKNKSSLINVDIDNANNENPNLVQYPPEVTSNLENAYLPSSEIINSGEKCPLYPEQNFIDPTPPYSFETLPVENVPSICLNANDASNLPYPTDPTMAMSQSQCSQFNSLSYENSSIQYPLIPPEKPPPSYSDVINENKY